MIPRRFRVIFPKGDRFISLDERVPRRDLVLCAEFGPLWDTMAPLAYCNVLDVRSDERSWILDVEASATSRGSAMNWPEKATIVPACIVRDDGSFYLVAFAPTLTPQEGCSSEVL